MKDTEIAAKACVTYLLSVFGLVARRTYTEICGEIQTLWLLEELLSSLA